MRAGASALEAGLADRVDFVGYRVDGLPDEEVIDPRRTIRRIGARPAKPGRPRLLRALSLPKWWWAARRGESSPEISIVTAHSIAALPAGYFVARRCGAGLLYDAHELETEREGWSPLIRWLARRFERFFIRRCDHTIVVNDTIRDWYLRAYPGASVSTVRNVPVIPKAVGESHLRRNLGLGPEPLLYAYCGLLGEGRGLREMEEAFAGLGDGHHFVMVGFGPLEESLRAEVDRHPNIHLHPAVPQSELIALLRGADVGAFLPTGTSISYHHSLPNKVFEYAAAGLAILVSDAPELARFSQEYPLARSVPASVERIRRAVLEWPAREIREGRASMRFQPPSWAEEVHRLLEAYAIVERRATSKRGHSRA